MQNMLLKKISVIKLVRGVGVRGDICPIRGGGVYVMEGKRKLWEGFV